MNEKKIRTFFMCSVVIISLIISGFLVIVNLNRLNELKSISRSLFVLVLFLIAILVFYFAKGKIFDKNGKLEKTQILLLTSIMFLIAQMTFAFASYANQKMELFFESTSVAKRINEFSQLYYEKNGTFANIENRHSIYFDQFDTVEAVFIANQNQNFLEVRQPISGRTFVGDKFSLYDVGIHVFPSNDGFICIKDSVAKEKERTYKMLSELLTIMAASIFLTIELMLYVMELADNRAGNTTLIDGKKPMVALKYVRQLAFLFYFASSLSGAFISVMAKKMGGSFMGLTGNVLAGIPQSAEILFTCGAIFITSVLIEKKGWKQPFVTGLVLVSAGNIFTAFAPDIIMFILSRAVVGLGYGFCWMTFRNFALFGRNEQEKTLGFSLLNAGLYAGINCGSVLGAVLAEKLGFSIVLCVSAVFTFICSVSVIRMENARYKKIVKELEVKEKPTAGMFLFMILFIVLMILPTCIADSFIGYYLPLYFTGTGHSIADAGRAKLLYGVFIVYAGPALAKYASNHPNYLRWNVMYNIIIGVAFVLFGMLGKFWPAYFAVILLSSADSFGFGVQNIYFTRMKAISRMGESFSMSLVSFIKKMAAMLGPITFGLVMSGAGTINVCILGAVFIAAAVIYFVVALFISPAVLQKKMLK